MDSSTIGKMLIIVGGAVVLLGAVILLAGRVPWLGRLPGDINIEREGFRFHFPIVTCLILSALLTAILWILGRGR
jgi:hypothetical protein